MAFYVIRVLGSCPHRGFDLTSSRLEDRRSDQMPSYPDASPSLGRLVYLAPSSTALDLHFGIEKYRLPWQQASESASDVPGSCPHRGFKFTSSRLAVRTSYQMASWPNASLSPYRLLYNGQSLMSYIFCNGLVSMYSSPILQWHKT